MRNMNTVRRLEEARPAGHISRPVPAGFVCTVGPHSRRHAGLFVPDERGLPRLVPACGIGVSAREAQRVVPYLFSSVVTCERPGCKAYASPDQPAVPRGEQLTLDLPLPR